MSFVRGCCFHKLFQILGNPDVQCRSHSKICATGLSVIRVTTFVVHRGCSRQRGIDNVDWPGNFGILPFHVHWAYINNILVILVGPNRLGRVVGRDNVWA